MSDWIHNAKVRLGELAELPENWDSYGGATANLESIRHAMTLLQLFSYMVLEAPKLTLSPDGNVFICFPDSDIEIEVAMKPTGKAGIQPENLDFQDFWSRYPARKGRKVGKKLALEEWDKLPLIAKSLILAAVDPYREYCEKIDRPPMDAHRWLKKRIYADFAIPEEPATNETGPSEGSQKAFLGRLQGKIDRDNRLSGDYRNGHSSAGTGIERRKIENSGDD